LLTKGRQLTKTLESKQPPRAKMKKIYISFVAWKSLNNQKKGLPPPPPTHKTKKLKLETQK
jgi:hypothetical protein